jgi:regulator of protease activity HflC (stomatin/prohibitin superfamily)
MQALVDFLIRNLARMWPVRRVNPWNGAMLVRGGKMRGALEPGLHWCWPFLDEVFLVISTEQAIDLPAGTAITTDGVSFAYSANLTYKVTDAPRNWSTVYNPDASIRNLAFGILSRSLAAHTWDELRERRTSIEAAALAAIGAEVSAWGVATTRLQVTDLTTVRALKLFGDGPAKAA